MIKHKDRESGPVVWKVTLLAFLGLLFSYHSQSVVSADDEYRLVVKSETRFPGWYRPYFCISDDGRVLVVAGGNRNVALVWNVSKGVVEATIEFGAWTEEFYPLVRSSSGEYVAASTDRGLAIVRLADSELISTMHGGRYRRDRTLCFSPDGSHIAFNTSRHRGELVVHNTGDGECVRRVNFGDTIRSLKWRSPERLEAVLEKSRKILDVENGRIEEVLRDESAASGTKIIDVVADGSTEVLMYPGFIGDDAVKIGFFDVADSAFIWEESISTEGYRSWTVSDSGEVFAFVERSRSSIRWIEGTTGREGGRFELPNHDLWECRVSRNGKVLVAKTTRRIFIWDLDTQQFMDYCTAPDGATAIAASKTGSVVALQDLAGVVWIMDATTLKSQCTITDGQGMSFAGTPELIWRMVNGERLAGYDASTGQNVKQYDLSDLLPDRIVSWQLVEGGRFLVFVTSARHVGRIELDTEELRLFERQFSFGKAIAANGILAEHPIANRTAFIHHGRTSVSVVDWQNHEIIQTISLPEPGEDSFAAVFGAGCWVGMSLFLAFYDYASDRISVYEIDFDSEAISAQEVSSFESQYAPDQLIGEHYPNYMAVSPHDGLIGLGDHPLTIRRVNPVNRAPKDPIRGSGALVCGLTYLDDDRIAAISIDGLIHIWQRSGIR